MVSGLLSAKTVPHFCPAAATSSCGPAAAVCTARPALTTSRMLIHRRDRMTSSLVLFFSERSSGTEGTSPRRLVPVAVAGMPRRRRSPRFSLNLQPRGIAKDGGACRHIARHHAARPDDRVVADGDARQDDRPTADPGIAADAHPPPAFRPLAA